MSEAKDFLAEHARDENFVILDVRTPKEYAQGHLPESILIDKLQDDFAAKIDALDRAKTYLLVCKSGGRAAAAAEIMSASGFNHLLILEKGINNWVGAGYPLTVE